MTYTTIYSIPHEITWVDDHIKNLLTLTFQVEVEIDSTGEISDWNVLDFIDPDESIAVFPDSLKKEIIRRAQLDLTLFESVIDFTIDDPDAPRFDRNHHSTYP